jgi:hypothetical protein
MILPQITMRADDHQLCNFLILREGLQNTVGPGSGFQIPVLRKSIYKKQNK